jgi:AraC-like DNA-binding protein
LICNIKDTEAEMINATDRSLDSKARSVKYVLMRLPHEIKIPPLAGSDLGRVRASEQTRDDQSLNAQWVLVNPGWSIYEELQVEIAACTLIALLSEPPAPMDQTPPANIADRRRGDRRQGGRRRSDLAVVKGFIDQSLALESLDATLIGRQFCMSRSSVYRLFESEGGLANYIRRCRLMQAFSLLVSPPVQGRRRILDVAVECGFSSDMVFTRAFRKMFSLTPSAVRSMAELQGPEFDDLLATLDTTSQSNSLPSMLDLLPKLSPPQA